MLLLTCLVSLHLHRRSCFLWWHLIRAGLPDTLSSGWSSINANHEDSHQTLREGETKPLIIGLRCFRKVHRGLFCSLFGKYVISSPKPSSPWSLHPPLPPVLRPGRRGCCSWRSDPFMEFRGALWIFELLRLITTCQLCVQITPLPSVKELGGCFYEHCCRLAYICWGRWRRWNI